MSEYNHIQNSFGNGELSPMASGLVGTTLMNNSVKECVGFMPTTEGFLMRAHGDKVIKENNIERMESLLINSEYFVIGFVLVAGLYKLCTWDYLTEDSDNSIVISTSGITYTKKEVSELCVANNKDVLYISHKSKPLLKVEITRGTSLTLLETPITAMKGFINSTECFNGIDDYPSIVAFKGGRMILSSTNNNPNTVWLSRTPSISDDAIPVYNNRYTDFTLYDYETKTTTIIKSLPLSTTINDEKTITEVQIDYSTSDISSFKRVSIYNNTTANGVYPKIATKTTITDIGTTLSNIIDSTITQEKTTTTSASATSTFTYSEPLSFTPPTIATETTVVSAPVVTKTIENSHAIQAEETDMYGSRIKWINTTGRMNVGTDKSIFIDDGSVATPSTFDLKVSSNETISSSKVLSLGSYIIFTGNNDKSLYLAHYDYESSGLIVKELSKYARHLLSSGIKDFSVMLNPYKMIYIVTNDGDIVTCLINENSSEFIGSFSKQKNHMKGTKFISIVVAGQYSNKVYAGYTGYISDEISDLKDTKLNGVSVSEITSDCDFDSNTIYVSNATVLTGTVDLTSYTTTRWKDGVTVLISNNGDFIGSKVVGTNGLITFSEPLSGIIIIGLQLESYVIFFNPLISSQYTGSYLINNFSILKVVLRLYKSNVAKIGLTDNNVLEDLVYKQFGIYEFNKSVVLQTGDFEINTATTNSRGNVKLLVEDPVPFNLLALSFKYRINN